MSLFVLGLGQFGLIWQKNITESFWVVNTALMVMSETLWGVEMEHIFLLQQKLLKEKEAQNMSVLKAVL